MHPIIENYLAKINNLSQIDPKNLPFDVLEAMAELGAEELFKTCAQLVILQNNIPGDEKVLSMNEQELISMAEDYAKKVINRLRQ